MKPDARGAQKSSFGGRKSPTEDKTTDPLFMKIGSEYYFYQNDHLGTPQKLTAVNGAVVWSAKYSSFGKVEIDHSFSITNNLRFAGQYFDEETGLNYNWHRYYSYRSGRYLRPDPIGFLGGDNNFYRYVLANPIRLIDAHGLANAGMAYWSFDSKPDPKDFIHLAPDPNNLPSAGFSIALNTVEVIEQDGCMFLCWGISTEVVGVFMSETMVDYGKKEASKIDPVSVYFGPIKNISVSTNPNSLDANVGASVSLPWVNFSARLVCFNLNRKSKNSCSNCENYPSSYFRN